MQHFAKSAFALYFWDNYDTTKENTPDVTTIGSPAKIF